MEELEPSLRRMSFGDSDTKHTYPEFYDAMCQHINNIGQHLRDSQFRLPTFLADFGQPSCNIAIAIVVIVALVTGFMGALKGATYSELIKLTTVTTAIVAPLLYIRNTAQLVKRIMNARNALFQGVVMFTVKLYQFFWWFGHRSGHGTRNGPNSPSPQTLGHLSQKPPPAWHIQRSTESEVLVLVLF
ncbi:uncharacterized protein ARMOST_18070 [Armillaria ostoyae]|uniref:Uncharacterized protein n=1 Tax=Armillaria ostoyae TaxID=47428 RepID=A0A284S0U3_ARMOS|nr:uncharacterized protein ARMOST_18070 [Armillaria ostoyae]